MTLISHLASCAPVVRCGFAACAIVLFEAAPAWAQTDFVRSVAPSSDGAFGAATASCRELVIVGANGADGLRGEAHLYRVESGEVVPTLLQTVEPTTRQVGDRLGWSVAIGTSHAALASPYPSGGAGSVWWLKLAADGSILQQGELLSPDSAPSDFFGQAIAIAGDWLFVGEPGDDALVNGGGAVHAYQWSGARGWLHRTKVLHPAPAVMDVFGYALAASEKWLVVASRYAENGAILDAGGAWVYEMGPDGPMFPPQRLVPPDAATWDWFGQCVDVDGDTIAVGVCRDGIGSQLERGSVRIFEPDLAGQWNQVATLIDPAGAAFDRVGASVDLRGHDVLAGADGIDASSSLQQTGALLRFTRTHAGWQHAERLLSSPQPSQQALGTACALGPGELVLGGAPKATVAGGPNREGLLYLWERAPHCAADIDLDLEVGGADLAALLSDWGSVGSSRSDIDGNQQVDAADLSVLLASWGLCD